MGYLIFELSTLLIVASIIGILAGYSLQNLLYKKQERKLNEELLKAQRERDEYKSRLQSFSDEGGQGVPDFKEVVCEVSLIDGIGGNEAKSLKKLGIKTNLDLLKLSGNPVKIIQVAEVLNIDEVLVTQLISKADLMRIPGLKKEETQVLEASGIRSVRQLATQNPRELSKKIISFSAAAKKNCTKKNISSWVNTASKLAGNV